MDRFIARKDDFSMSPSWQMFLYLYKKELERMTLDRKLIYKTTKRNQITSQNFDILFSKRNMSYLLRKTSRKVHPLTWLFEPLKVSDKSQGKMNLVLNVDYVSATRVNTRDFF